MIRLMTVLVVAAAVVAGPAFAHEKGDRAIGVVESITADQIVIKASDGHVVPFALVPDTRFSVGDKTAGAQDVRAGQRAVVHGKRSGDKLIAVRVKLAPHKR